MTVTILCGGPIGVEFAGAFADLVRRALKLDYQIEVNDFLITLINPVIAC
jgi:NADH dehydrogenase FAD-containing subunit